MLLALEDGTELLGQNFGASRHVAGEVVFNTAMTGYVETLTDPSYRGQILVLTYPIVGNYGVPAPRKPCSLDRPYESNQIQIQGLIVQHYVDDYSHPMAERSLSEWLKSENIPAVTGVDTRTLTQHLRERGTMRASIMPHERISNAEPDMVCMESVLELVSPNNEVRYPGGKNSILVVDVGAKDNIIRSLTSRGASVIRSGCQSNLSELATEADGVVIGSGPGDPTDASRLTAELAHLLRDYRKPVLGICLGHQILARALGAATFKLKYGHRSVNQPVQDQVTRRCFVTSQNHGYAVDDDTLPGDWEPWFVNLNDGTNEGIRSVTKPFFSVQFHPEASPGPQDTGYLFDDFLRLVQAIKQG
jgi:carbamoyl-phosphate synthase small subunit